QVRQQVVAEAEGAAQPHPPEGEPTGQPRLRLTRFADLYRNRKPVVWRVKNMLPETGVAFLYGPSGECKTFVVVDLAAHIALGLPFRDAATKAGSVAILAGEGNEGLVRRVSAWVQAHQTTVDIDMHISESGGSIDTPEGLTEVFAALDALPVPPGVVFIDTQSRWQVGDESSTRDGAAFIRALDAIRDRYACLVVVVAHTPVADPERMRGSSTFRGAADAQFLVRKTLSKGKNVVTMTCKKSKDVEEAPALAWELKQITLNGFETEDGEAVTSCWLSPTEAAADTHAGRPAKDIPYEIAVTVVKEYPGALSAPG
ncbi:MAG: AAA family ATPase, partial [Limnospira sp. PMC 1234.20]